MQCDLCGKQTQLFHADVEGARLKVCSSCGKLGKTYDKIIPPRTAVLTPKKQAEPEILDVIVGDYAQKIKQSREKLGINQHDLALKLNEKESIIQKIESGHFEPSLKMAEKLSSMLNVQLIETVKDEAPALDHSETTSFTLGDFIKVKKRKTQ